jgi:hypothetical protein
MWALDAQAGGASRVRRRSLRERKAIKNQRTNRRRWGTHIAWLLKSISVPKVRLLLLA